MINQAFPEAELEERVVEIAARIAQVPPAVVAVNKRFVYTAVEARGGRAMVRTGNDRQAGPHLQALDPSALIAKVKGDGGGSA
jgi:enoyl-CoA hydratase/carnithine racemase